jgi:hypothetical protein
MRGRKPGLKNVVPMRPDGVASGLRTQKCEIKNKKPTVSESHAMPALLHQLRRGCAKMIRFESLGENFRAFRGIHQRCCTRRHRRRASNFVVTVSNLNRFESLPAESQCRTRAVRGGGGLNPWAVWGPLPHGASRADFFSSGGVLKRCAEIKRSNDARQLRGLASQLGEGVVKSRSYFRADRVATSREFPQNSENFF